MLSRVCWCQIKHSNVFTTFDDLIKALPKKELGACVEVPIDVIENSTHATAT